MNLPVNSEKKAVFSVLMTTNVFQEIAQTVSVQKGQILYRDLFANKTVRDGVKKFIVMMRILCKNQGNVGRNLCKSQGNSIQVCVVLQWLLEI